MGTNITKERVLRDVLQHSKSNNTSFHIENANSRVSGVENKEDTKAIREYLEYWKDKEFIVERKQGVFYVPPEKRDKVQEKLDEMKYDDDLTIKRN
jgi:hypothetical protein